MASHAVEVHRRCHDRPTRIQCLGERGSRAHGASPPQPGRLCPGRCAMLPTMPSKDASAFLKTSPVFAVLPAREIEALGAVTVEETHRPREYIFMEGDPSRWFCVVKSGHVKIVRHSRTGSDVVLELLGPGEVFGGVAVIEKRPYPATGQAAEPTVVLKLPAEPIIALADRHPALVKEMALMIGRRLRSAHDSVESLAVDPVEARLARTLVR